MSTSTGPSPARARVYWVLTVPGSLIILGTGYAFWVAHLFVFSDQGAVPPDLRVPDVPAGAEVLRAAERCASGGCWREILVRPASGQTPQALAEDMGVAEWTRHGWHLLDPHAVSIGSRVEGDELVVHVQYATSY